jgi:hypothetical protein
MTDLDPAEITKEVDLWDIYVQSRKLPEGRLSKRVAKPFSWAILVILSIYAALSNKPVNELANEVRSLADLGFNFSISILGFLVAGFTIFATVTKPNLFIKLAKVKHTKSGLSYLKYTFFVFMYVFIAYLSFTLFCLLIKLLASPSGVISTALICLSNYPEHIDLSKRILAGVGIATLGTWAFHLIILLQSFIFNIYITVMTSIRWEIQNNNSENGSENGES